VAACPFRVNVKDGEEPDRSKKLIKNGWFLNALVVGIVNPAIIVSKN
jgi:hypothetical protein